MHKKSNFKSHDNETTRSILKSNSPRQIRDTTSSSKAINGYGIFKRTSLYEAKSGYDVLSTSIRETRSESVAPNMGNFKRNVSFRCISVWLHTSVIIRL